MTCDVADPGPKVEPAASAASATVSLEGFDACVSALRLGHPVVFPTDTVYGIGVAALHAPSLGALFAAKRRPADKPVAWLVGGVEALEEFGEGVPALARELVDAHWPGALTVVVRASRAVPLPFRSQAGTIGLRMPASDAALSLVRAVGPIAASSANLSGVPAPRVFAEVDPILLRGVRAWMQDDASCASGTASTVVDCASGDLRVVRQGGVAVARQPSRR